jgi:hypothetical protein
MRQDTIDLQEFARSSLCDRDTAERIVRILDALEAASRHSAATPAVAEAARPFAECLGTRYEGFPGDMGLEEMTLTGPTLGDFRKLRAALDALKETNP